MMSTYDIPLHNDRRRCSEKQARLSRLLAEWRKVDPKRGKRSGETWFLVDKRWYDRLQEYLNDRQEVHLGSSENSSSHLCDPGKIRNHELLDTMEGALQCGSEDDIPDSPDWKNDIKPTITENDYVALPEECWKILKKYFGGGPSLPKYCVSTQSGEVVFEERVRVTVRNNSPAKDGLTHFRVPHSMKLSKFREQIFSELDLVPEDHRLLFPDLNTDPTDADEDSTFSALGLTDSFNCTVEAVEKESASSSFKQAREPVSFSLVEDVSTCTVLAPSPAIHNSLQLHRSIPAIGPSRLITDSVVSSTIGRIPGLAGLKNLGNTCFMNSALQCLLHCAPVLQTFLSGRFYKDINRVNPLGKNGEVATAFGSLLQKMWRGDVDYVSPEGFKHILGKHAVQFQSYDQHDSQEFLSYLLDMLHEDLNRIINKPYIEVGEDAGKDDQFLAAEAWGTYRARNDSAIVDHFQGLLKSTLDCPNCGYHKRKFDPFMYLSVPLPGADTVLREVIVVPMDGSFNSKQYCVKVFKNDTVGAFLEAMAVLLGIRVDYAQHQLVAISINSSRVNILDDLSKELPPKSSFSSERLVVYSFPGTALGEDRTELKAIIMPPDSTSYLASTLRSPLPLLVRVPEGAIELEEMNTKSYTSHVSRHTFSRKRYHLRSDCELARCVEDLLTPLKRPRTAVNLVYSPPLSSGSSSACDEAALRTDPVSRPIPELEDTEMVEDGNSTADLLNRGDAATGDQHPAQMDDVVTVTVATEEFSLDSPDKCGPNTLVDTVGVPVSSASVAGTAADVAEGVPVATVAEGVPSSLDWGSSNTKVGRLEPQASKDGVVGFVPTAPPLPSKPAINGHILGPVRSPKPLEAVPSTIDGSTEKKAGVQNHLSSLHVNCSEGQIASQNGTSERTDGDQEGKPAFRLLAVNESGYAPSYWNANDGSTRFFQFDVGSADAKQLFDVEAMGLLSQHESMKQLEVTSTYSLEQCIKGYLASEVLGPSDRWHCPKCRNDVRATKALDLWHLPEVLIIHLKRFSYQGSGYYSTMSSKIDNLVTFPLQGLDMTEFVHEGYEHEAVYDCFAVSNHMGSVGGGHYTAHCLLDSSLCISEKENCGWHCYNDRCVSPSGPSSVVSSSAYVLFYRRRSKANQDPENVVQSCKFWSNVGKHMPVFPVS